MFFFVFFFLFFFFELQPIAYSFWDAVFSYKTKENLQVKDTYSLVTDNKVDQSCLLTV